jgi:dipeptidyl aminopeptidase/acylaminoacyl peptidase
VLRLWDTATGNELHHWGVNWISSLSFSPDNKTLAGGSGTDLLVHLWDVATGKELRTLGPHRGGVETVVFSPDGRTLATAAMDHILTLWELATGRERLVIKTDANATALAFAPGGRWIASVNNGRSRHIADASNKHLDVGNENRDQVSIWDVATGREVRRLAGHAGGINSVAFSPNGKLLVTGSMDTTALVWDAAGLLPATPSRSKSLTVAELEAFWCDLAGADTGRAHRAIWSMAEAPGASVPFLKEHLPPAPTADPQRVAKLLTDLNSDRFAVREKSLQELEKLGESIGSALEKALQEKPSLEVQRRIERLLTRLKGESLRISRAVEVLERVQSAEAHRLLEDLARGEKTAQLSREAKAALERVAN